MSDDPASHDAFKWEQRMSQIQRLRTLLEVDCTVNAERNMAAWTIYNLMLDAKELNADIMQLRQEVADLRGERDEARRRLCAELLEVEGHPFGWKGAAGAKGIAERLGWDCFKEKPIRDEASK